MGCAHRFCCEDGGGSGSTTACRSFRLPDLPRLPALERRKPSIKLATGPPPCCTRSVRASRSADLVPVVSASLSMICVGVFALVFVLEGGGAELRSRKRRLLSPLPPLRVSPLGEAGEGMLERLALP